MNGWHRLAVTLVLVTAWLVPAPVSAADEFPQRFERATLIHIDGEINRRQMKFFTAKLQAARRRQSDLVILVIDSPGGTLDESMAIGEAMRDVDWAKTVALIPRRAISGAAPLARLRSNRDGNECPVW